MKFELPKSPRLGKALVYLSVFGFLAYFCTNFAYASAFNKQINYQGRLTDSLGIVVADDSYDIVFNLYSASTGGTPVWTESRTGANAITVTGGLFSVLLGSLNDISPVNFNQDLYLGVTINSDDEMTPRKRLGAVPAAFEADRLDGYDSADFLHSGETYSTSTINSIFTINQLGAGDLLDLQKNGTSVFSVSSSGLASTSNLLVSGIASLGTSVSLGGEAIARWADIASLGNFWSTTSADTWDVTKNRWGTSSSDIWVATKTSLPNLGTLAGLFSVGSSTGTTTLWGSIGIGGVNTGMGLLVAGNNATTLSLGSSTAEGGDIAVYEDSSNHKSLSFDADAAKLTINKTLINDWVQVNTDGFGREAPFSSEDFFAFETFNGCLYAGIEGNNVTEGAQVYRTCDGTSWTLVNDTGFGDATNNDHVDSMRVFNGWLYVSTGQIDHTYSGTEIWRTRDGTTWIQSNTDGFGSSDNENTKSLTVYNGHLCGGTWNTASGAAVWCTKDGTTWEKKSPDGFNGDPNNKINWDLNVFDGYLYASVQNQVTGGEIWRTNDLKTWTNVITAGGGYGADNKFIPGPVAFNGAAYIFQKDGLGAGLEVKKSYDGLNFDTTYTFFDATSENPAYSNISGPFYAVYNGQLYLSLTNTVTGMQVWRSANGTNWSQVNTSGFGDVYNAYAKFIGWKGYLYAGVANFVSGQRILRMNTGVIENTSGAVLAQSATLGGIFFEDGFINGVKGFNADYGTFGNLGVSGNFAVGDINMSAGSAFRYNGEILAQASTTLDNYFFGGAGNLTMTGASNVANGYQALFSNTTGSANTANGGSALLNNTIGISNTAVGATALYSNNSGSFNTAMGSETLFRNSTGSTNTAIGYQALYYNTTGSGNIAIGYEAGAEQADGITALTSATNSIYIGAGTMGYNNSDVNSIVIGYQAKGIGANSVVLGNDSITTTALKGNVGIGTTSPSARLTVWGGTTDATILANFVNSASSSILTIQNNGTLTSAGPFVISTTTATSTIAGAFDVGGGALTYDNITGITSISSLTTGALSFEADAGLVPWTDMPITSNSSQGAQVGYTAQLGGLPMLSIFGTVTDAAGTLGNLGVVIGTSSVPSARFEVWGSGTTTGHLADFVNAASTSIMTILENGNVGIGSSTPLSTLSVSGVPGTSPFTIASSTGVQMITLSQDGRFGIGTTTPKALLDVTGEGNIAQMVVSESLSGGTVRLSANSTFPYSPYIGTTSNDPFNFVTNNRYRLTIDATGNVGIGGTTTPQFGLTLASTTATGIASMQIANGGLCVDDDGWCAPSAGVIAAVSYTTGHSDLAENYPAIGSVEKGDIVSISSDGNGYGVKIAEPSSQAFGIISTNPAIILGLDDDRPDHNDVPVALTGRVPVKVSTENGQIKIGDYIQLGSIPGVGMRATTSGEMVGVALEAFGTSTSTFSVGSTTRGVATGKIMVFVKSGYQSVNLYKKDGLETKISQDLWTVDYETGAIKPFAALDMVGLDINNVKAILSQNGKWGLNEDGELTVQKLCIGATCIDESELRALLDHAGLQGASVPLLPDDGNSGTTGGAGSSSQSTDPVIGDDTGSTTPPNEGAGDDTTGISTDTGEDTTPPSTGDTGDMTPPSAGTTIPPAEPVAPPADDPDPTPETSPAENPAT